MLRMHPAKIEGASTHSPLHENKQGARYPGPLFLKGRAQQGVNPMVALAGIGPFLPGMTLQIALT